MPLKRAVTTDENEQEAPMPHGIPVMAKQEILQLKQLPPLSITASRLLAAASDPEIEVDELALIIGGDPALAARILGIANSAYFAHCQPVLTVRDAIIRVLGLNMVKSLAVSIALCGTFDTERCKRFKLEQWWCGALTCAALSRLLAVRVKTVQPIEPDAVYLCGLMHNLGSLVLAFLFPEEFSEVLAAQEREPANSSSELELAHVGYTRCQAAGWVAERWHMPAVVAEVSGSLARSDYSGKFGTELAIVRGAARWIQQQQQGAGVSLGEDGGLRALPGLDELALAAIEEQMLDQYEAFRVQSGLLV